MLAYKASMNFSFRAITATTLTSILLAAGEPAAAAGTCNDFTRATAPGSRNHDLFAGYIVGAVRTKMTKWDGPAFLNAVERVTALTAAYCREKPNDNVYNVIAAWTDVLTRAK